MNNKLFGTFPPENVKIKEWKHNLLFKYHCKRWAYYLFTIKKSNGHCIYDRTPVIFKISQFFGKWGFPSVFSHNFPYQQPKNKVKISSDSFKERAKLWSHTIQFQRCAHTWNDSSHGDGCIAACNLLAHSRCWILQY